MSGHFARLYAVCAALACGEDENKVFLRLRPPVLRRAAFGRQAGAWPASALALALTRLLVDEFVCKRGVADPELVVSHTLCALCMQARCYMEKRRGGNVGKLARVRRTPTWMSGHFARLYAVCAALACGEDENKVFLRLRPPVLRRAAFGRQAGAWPASALALAPTRLLVDEFVCKRGVADPELVVSHTLCVFCMQARCYMEANRGRNVGKLARVRRTPT